MELLGLFLIALLVVAFPKQGLKAIGLCLGAGAMLVCVVGLWLYLIQLDTQRHNAVFAAEYEAEKAQEQVAIEQQQEAIKSLQKSDAQIEEEHQARMRQQGIEERPADHWTFGLQPLYVKPELVPTLTPPPVSKPTPTPIPVPAKPETLYTSN